MVEELWDHALHFLDTYRNDISNHDIKQLYQFQDTTGILETHKLMFENIFMDSKVDMKIIFYELIRMLLEYRSDEFEDINDAKSIKKIEGYQDLTNKLLRYLCKCGNIELKQFKLLVGETLDDNNNKFNQLESKMVTAEQTSDSILERLNILEAENRELREGMRKLEQSKEIVAIKSDHTYEANPQDELSLIKDELQELKKSPVPTIVDNIQKQIEEERAWTEQALNYLERKCQTDLIQTQSDIISNTNEISKIIENQMKTNDRVKKLEEESESDIQVIREIMQSKELSPVEQSNDSHVAEEHEFEVNKRLNEFRNNLDSVFNEFTRLEIRLKDEFVKEMENIALSVSSLKDELETQKKTILRVTNGFEEKIEIVTSDKETFTTSILEQVKETSEKIEYLKNIIHSFNERLEENVRNEIYASKQGTVNILERKEKEHERSDNVTLTRIDAIHQDFENLREEMDSLRNQINLHTDDAKAEPSNQHVQQTFAPFILSRQEDLRQQKSNEIIHPRISTSTDNLSPKKSYTTNEFDHMNNQTTYKEFSYMEILEKKVEELTKESVTIKTSNEKILKTLDQLQNDLSVEILRVNCLEALIQESEAESLDKIMSKTTNNYLRSELKCENILKENTHLKESNYITQLYRKGRNESGNLNSDALNKYNSILLKTEANDTKLERLEKTVKQLQVVGPAGRIKTEQMEFISRKIEEQKRTLELFFKSVEEKFKSLEKASSYQTPTSNIGDDEIETAMKNEQEQKSVFDEEKLTSVDEERDKLIEADTNQEMLEMQECFQKQGSQPNKSQRRRLSLWMKKRRKAFCCSCIAKQPSMMSLERIQSR